MRTTLAAVVMLASAGVSHAAITVNSIALTSQQPGVRTTYNIQITPDADLDDGDLVRLTFPSESNFNEVSLNSVTGTNISGFNSFSTNNTTKVLEFRLSASDSGQPIPDAITIELIQLHNPYTAGSHSIDFETRDNDNGDALLDSGTGNFTINAALLTVNSIVLDNSLPSATGVTYTVTFTPTTFIEHGYIVEFLFPTGTDLSSAGVALNNTVIGQNPDLTGVSVNSTTDNHLFIQVQSNLTSGEDIAGTFAFDLTGIVNSPTAAIHTMPVAIYDTGFNATEGGFEQFELAETGILNEANSLSDSSIGATNVTYTMTFDYTGALDTDDTIVLTFPAAIDISGVTNGDISLSGGTLTKGTATINGQVITIPVASGTFSDQSATITINGINNPSNANQAGVYYIAVQLFDEGVTFLEQGSFPTAIGSTVQITALVTEALVMTLSGNTITLTVDPSVNSGIDTSQYTGVTIYSNAAGGYALSARLDDGAGAAQLTNGTGGIIPTGTGDGTLGYEATNATYDGGRIVNGSDPFGNTNTPLLDNADAPLGSATVADPLEHTVYYDLDVNFLTPAGVYTGTIFYTVTAAF